MALLILALLGCSRPPGLEGCAGIRDGETRETCRFEEAKALAAAGRIDALTAGLATIEDPMARDLLVVRLVVDDTTLADRLCPAVTTEAGKQRCQQILGRPHLRSGP